MNKTDFLQQLEQNLAGASPEERVAAMQYYTEYLDEAGPEREAEVLAELGSPAQVAAEVLGAQSNGSPGGWTPPQKPAQPVEAEIIPPGSSEQRFGAAPGFAGAHQVFEQAFGEEGGQIPIEQPQPAYPVPVPPATNSTATQYNQGNTNVAKIILIVIAIIFLSPVLGGLLGALGGLLAALIVVFLVPIILCATFIPAGIVSIVAGAIMLSASAGTGLMSIGGGLLLVGLGLLCGYGGGVLLGRVLPKMIKVIVRGIKTLFQKLFH